MFRTLRSPGVLLTTLLATGWMAPQLNWPMAIAKLMVAMPSPVALLCGLT